jgi:hypothetical protein
MGALKYIILVFYNKTRKGGVFMSKEIICLETGEMCLNTALRIAGCDSCPARQGIERTIPVKQESDPYYRVHSKPLSEDRPGQIGGY